MLTPEEQNELQRLLREHIPIRAIARRLGRRRQDDPASPGPPAAPAPPPSKLAPYQALAKEQVPGGPALAPDPARTAGAGLHGRARRSSRRTCRRWPRAGRRTRQTFRRFETGPGIEAQSDWSPYRVTIAGRETIVHAFAMVLGTRAALRGRLP